MEDPSGNSFIENLNAPKVDPALTVSHFTRTQEQNHLVGIYEEELKQIVEEEEPEG